MPNNNEEKKWKMYKRALVIKDFTSSVIPTFTSVGGNTATNEYGSWTAIGKFSTSSSSFVQETSSSSNTWKVFDKNTSTYITTGSASSLKEYRAAAYIKAPEGWAICPKKVRIKITGATYQSKVSNVSVGQGLPMQPPDIYSHYIWKYNSSDAGVSDGTAYNVDGVFKCNEEDYWFSEIALSIASKSSGSGRIYEFDIIEGKLIKL